MIFHTLHAEQVLARRPAPLVFLGWGFCGLLAPFSDTYNVFLQGFSKECNVTFPGIIFL